MMTGMDNPVGLREALDAFDFGGVIVDTQPYGAGHINSTFTVSTRQDDGPIRRFVLQLVNTQIFTDPTALMENIVGVTTYLRRQIASRGGDPDRETLSVIPTTDGRSFFRASDDTCWRAFLFIENMVCHQSVNDPAVFRDAGSAFGNFARQLGGYPAATLHETIPHFHDTPVRHAAFEQAVAEDTAGRARTCGPEIAFARARREDCSVLTDLLAAGDLPLRVTHNDTKLNNVLMDPDTGLSCVIDLDTVMPGLVAYDFGDAIRFGASTAAEDETNLDLVSLSLDLYEAYTAGYLAAAGPILTPVEIDSLAWGARLITFENGIRFLTDYLNGDVYFHTARPTHNLDRCRTQFALVSDMESHFDAMQEIVRRQHEIHL